MPARTVEELQVTPIIGSGDAPEGFWETVEYWAGISDPTEVRLAVESSLAAMAEDRAEATANFIESASEHLAELVIAKEFASDWRGEGEALQDLMTWFIVQGREAFETAASGSVAEVLAGSDERMEFGFAVREGLESFQQSDCPSVKSSEEYVLIEIQREDHWIYEAAGPILGDWVLLAKWGADQGGVFEVPMSVATEICEESTLDALEEHGLIERHGEFVRLLDGDVPGLGPLWTYVSSTTL